jgi:uncharacterized protein DUF3300
MRNLVGATAVALLLVWSGGAAPYRSAAMDWQAAQKTATPTTKPPTSAADLDRLLAPIALYPDQLLAQMLLCATNPGKLGALSEWLASHQNLKGTELQDAATKSGFDPSYVALVLFPDVLHTMASNMDSTTRIGQAFETNRSAVFDSIQRLRKKAQDVGKLKDSPQQDVETKTTSSGQQVIVIEPSNPQVVYVPQYNPTTVYTQPTTSTVVVHEDNTGEAVAAGLIGFTAGIALGAAMDNNYYYGPYGWHGGAYMYNDAWDDWYDDREDAREDWYDNREDLAEERSDRAKNAQEQRTERTESRAENRPETQQQRTERQQNRQETRPDQAQREQRRSDVQSAAGTSSYESRGHSGERSQTAKTETQRSGAKSDAFSNYSSGKSERAASQRGQRSRSSSRSGGSRRR